MEDKLLEALITLAFRELCIYIDMEGNPVICDYDTYCRYCEQEFNHFMLSEEQFNLIKDYLEKTYKGKF